MTKKVFTLTFLSIVFLTGIAFISADWVLLQKDNYKILFPAAPSVDSTKTETAMGTLNVYTYMFESQENATDSNLVYGFSVTDYPAKYILSTDKTFLKGFFDGAIKGVVANIKGKILGEKDITFKNYPGREVKIDYAEGTAIVTMKIILVNARAFGLQTISFPGKEINSSAAKFYNSFDVN